MLLLAVTIITLGFYVQFEDTTVTIHDNVIDFEDSTGSVLKWILFGLPGIMVAAYAVFAIVHGRAPHNKLGVTLPSNSHRYTLPMILLLCMGAISLVVSQMIYNNDVEENKNTHSIKVGATTNGVPSRICILVAAGLFGLATVVSFVYGHHTIVSK